MSEIRTEININGTAEQVWNELMDFDKFPEWNPFLREIIILDSPLKVGSKLKANIDGMTIKPKVVKVIPNKEFHWFGRFLLPKIFDGRHMFEIEKINENEIKFIQKEKFKGIFVSLILKFIRNKTKNGFENMNQALKARVEAS
ncbi:MAG: SRPBCC family protein [Candidatus Thorarchaeota archaeon]